MGVNKHLSETACPRFALLSAEAVPPKVIHCKDRKSTSGESVLS